MKLKKSDINLILVLVGVLIAVVAYFFVYKTYNEKSDVLNAENATLQTEVDHLQELADNKQQYIDETASMQAEIDEIKAQFPAAYKEEDDILYVRSLEKDFDSFVTALGIGTPAVIEVATAASEPAPVAEETDGVEGEEGEAGEAVVAVTSESVTPDILLYNVPLTVEMISSYASVKDVIQKINTDRDRKSIQQISMAFDSETGDLAVNLNYNAYSLTGTDAIYETPTVDGIRYGSNNIFNTAEKKQAIEAQKAAAAAANE